MKQMLYLKMAFTNIKKNRNTFFPMMISSAIVIGMLYMLSAITGKADGSFFGGAHMQEILSVGIYICGGVCVIILLYANSFLMKRRTKELGLYNVLGLEKRHICRVLFWEIMMVAGVSLVIGLIFGVIFSKLIFLLLLNMLHIKPTFDFSISGDSLLNTAVFFLAIYFVITLMNCIKIARIKPVEMMGTASTGEKEPKANWVVAVLGVVCLGIGYYGAVTIENPLKAINYFVFLVAFVIAGTYLLFIAGSNALLKIIKKNKYFYYHKTHFVTVSGMLYRMKQNAVGLASICILSTMVIITVSTTVSLYLGIDGMQRDAYPEDVMVELQYKEMTDAKAAKIASQMEALSSKLAKEKNVTITDVKAYTEKSCCYLMKNNKLLYYDGMNAGDIDDMVFIAVMKDTDYNALTGSDYHCKDNQGILLSDERFSYKGNSLTLGSKEIALGEKGILDEKLTEPVSMLAYLLVSDYEQVDDLITEKDIKMLYNYTFDLKGKKADKEAFGNEFRAMVKNADKTHYHSVSDYYTSMQETVELFASIFFIGIFCGTMFLVTTVLIIYYKQITEGYDDRKNFQIMSKIGLSSKEITGIINSQIRMVFFLPIAVAVVHVIVAFPIVKKIMAMLRLTDTKLFVLGVAGTIVVFTIAYFLVYKVTSKIYYNIVKQAEV